MRKPARGEKAFDDRFAPRWRAVASGDDTLDLARTLGVASHRAGPLALVGGVLSTPKAFAGWLLVAADGGVTVAVDGKQALSRDVEKALTWEAVPLRLSEGEHTLVLGLHHRGRAWRFAARILDEKNLLPPLDMSLRLPSTTASESDHLLRKLCHTSVEVEVEGGQFRPLLSVQFPRGAPKESLAISAVLQDAGGKRFDVVAGSVPMTGRGVFDVRTALPHVLASDAPERATVVASVGNLTSQHGLIFPRELPVILSRAEKRLELLRAGRLPELADRDTIVSTVEHLTEELRASLRSANEPNVSRRVRELDDLLDDLDDGRDPLHASGVVLDLAHRSPLDRGLHSFLLHVPNRAEAKPKKRFPLVVALHGYRGSPEGILKAFLGRLTAHPHVDGFVIAPEAFGDAFYRGPAEREVMDLVDWVTKTYPIDQRRISITGVSMGGTGTAHIALRYPDRFSAAAPLAGYHSYFVRRDTEGKPRRPWEEARMRAWSPASWTKNGRYLPMHVAHGTQDYPLINSKVLIRSYKDLGFEVTEEWPHTGHSVWNVTYAGARMWPTLSRHEQTSAPSRVTLVADSLRYGKSYWAKITGLASRTDAARLDASLESPSSLKVTTKNVSALSLDPPGRSRRAPIVVRIDRDRLRIPPKAPVELTKGTDGWRLSEPAGSGSAAMNRKHPSSEGPIRDIFLEPVLFVYGASDPATARANREVAAAFATRYSGSARYPLFADTELSNELAESHSLFLVGTRRDHALLSRISAKLPIEAGGAALRFGSRSFDEDQVGAAFVAPHPLGSRGCIVVITAPSPAGIWRALSLPKLLPDFVVYDARLATAASEQILGETQVLASGFFDESWEIPTVSASAGETKPSADAAAASAPDAR